MTNLISSLVSALFEAEDRRLEAAITALNSKNKEAKGVKIDGFMYGGRVYRPKKGNLTIPGKGQPTPTLHFTLSNDMRTLLADENIVNLDKDLIRQTLFRLLKSCRSEQEIRDALPECLVSIIERFRQLPRSAEAGWTLRGDERAMRQFNKAVPKIEFYVASRLMF